MPDYQNNSHKAKEGGKPTEEKKIERITSAEVVMRKKGPWRTFKGLIIEADMGSVGRFVWLDLLVPTVKNVLVDVVEQGVKRLVYGDLRAGYRPPSSMLGTANRGLTSYTSYSQQPTLPSQRYADPRGIPQLSAPRASADARGYIIVSRDEAETVLETMAGIIDRYDVVTVADLHEMIGLSFTPIDNRWGWTDVRDAQIRQIREGWLLEVPQPLEMPA